MNNRRSIALLFALTLAVAGCGASTIPLVNGPQTPAAQGKVVMESGDNGNLKLKIEVKHLALPEKVSAGATTYSVWIQPEGAVPQNIGALKVDGDLTGRLETVTPLHAFELFITTEEDQTLPAPKGPRVLSGMVSQ